MDACSLLLFAQRHASAGVSWSVFGKAIIGWVFTLIIVGLISALLMALGIFTPNLRGAEAIANIRQTVGETAPWIAGNATASCPNTPVRRSYAHARWILPPFVDVGCLVLPAPF